MTNIGPDYGSLKAQQAGLLRRFWWLPLALFGGLLALFLIALCTGSCCWTVILLIPLWPTGWAAAACMRDRGWTGRQFAFYLVTVLAVVATGIVVVVTVASFVRDVLSFGLQGGGGY